MENRQSQVERAFIYVTTLFFAWGFVTSTIDPLVASVRKIFTLSYSESLLTQFAFFMAYGIVSLPSAAVVARLGAAKSIVVALLVMVVGCLIMPLATSMRTYEVVLVALFVLAAGITLLQVAANPLAAALGRPERSHLRLTLSQAFNSLGTVLGPFLGAQLMLGGGMFESGGDIEANRTESLHHVDIMFVLIAVAIGALALFIWRLRGLITESAPAAEAEEGASVLKAFRSGWAMFGALAIFLYVGAEVSIGSIMINFLNQPTVLDADPKYGGELLGWLYWGGAMVGRFAGSWAMTKVKPGLLLTGVATVAALLCVFVSQSTGMPAAAAALSVGLFNAIMFPTIFTLTLERSSAPVPATSGLLCVAIVGGAFLPQVVGRVADGVNLATAFLVPAAAYFGIVAFAAASSRMRKPAVVVANI